ncbi:hypothetical protein [Parvularcula lutaonensis]|uniref:DUF1570 domain-containing protein n=1 Tax=Parvularcula lutaonensis TaxID=491923 RepID=A0ABV7M9H6_9PROT|nr:hypothetical protein [Parvularcula lutaonensis]GGY45371.1 hypothetical protein GCM10007148_12930 [Parvularcula lutaonensis]
MNMRPAALFLVLAPWTPLAAKWAEARSENFVFAGQVSEEQAVQLVRELELYRFAVLSLLRYDTGPEVHPVEVFGIRGQRGMEKLSGSRGIAGVYRQATDGPVFLLDTRDGLDPGEDSRSTALHEFAHHIINSKSAQFIPRWYNEGFAEFLSSFRADGDVVTLGTPRISFANSLRYGDWMPWEEVFGAVVRYPDWSSSSRIYWPGYFYGQSWLAVHYIQFTPEMSGKFGNYLALINNRVDGVEAFEKGFEITLDAFEKDIRRYFNRDNYPITQLRFADSFPEPDIAVRTLTPGETLRAQLRAMSAFVSGADERHQRWMERQLEKSLAQDGKTMEVLDGYLALSMARDDHDAAVAWGEEALALYPGEPRALRIAGDAHFHRYQAAAADDEKEADRQDLIKARRLFAEQLAVDPKNPTANAHYVETFTLLGHRPDQLAMDAAAFNISLRRNASFTDTHLTAAELYLLGGFAEAACERVRLIEPWLVPPRDTDPDPVKEAWEKFEARLDKVREQLPAGCLAA